MEKNTNTKLFKSTVKNSCALQGGRYPRVKAKVADNTLQTNEESGGQHAPPRHSLAWSAPDFGLFYDITGLRSNNRRAF